MKSILRRISIVIVFFLTSCAAESPKLAIRGEITLSPALTSKIEPSDVVFVMALPLSPESLPESARAESQGEATLAKPVAVKKITPVIFPIVYELTRDDVLFPEQEFKGQFEILVRVDKDGNLKTAAKGDLEGSSKRPVKAGSQGIDIVVDRER